MLTVRKLRYFDFASAAAASLVLVATTGDNFADQVSSTSEFIHTAQVTNGGVFGGGANGGNGGVNNGGVFGGGANGGNGGVNNGGVINGARSTNSPGALGGGSTYRPR
jgi:hypothetical protein